jgi:hypothetical protein
MIVRTFREVQLPQGVIHAAGPNADGVITLSLPMPPNLANERGHSRWSGANKKRYFKRVDKLAEYNLIPGPPVAPLERTILSAWMGLGANMDDENAKLRAYKWPADYLRTRGYILADDSAHCTMTDPERAIVPLAKRGLVITIAVCD